MAVYSSSRCRAGPDPGLGGRAARTCLNGHVLGRNGLRPGTRSLATTGILRMRRGRCKCHEAGACEQTQLGLQNHVYPLPDLESVPPDPCLMPLESVLHRSEEHTSELQSLMRTSYAVFCLKNKKINVY